MKKTFLILALGLTPAVALLSNTYAQHSSLRTLLIKDAKTLMAIPVTDTAAAGSVNLSSNTLSGISTRAIKSFDKSFKEATGVTWYTIPEGFGASFTKDGNFNRAYYDRKGNLTFNITYYNGKKLPRDVYAIVKSTYFDCTIPFVEEIHSVDQIVYIVHLEDETSWKKVKVTNGEMEVLEDFSKN